MPSKRPCEMTIWTIAVRPVPSTRRSAIACRRSGTVRSSALNANRNPSSALIAANRSLAWPLGRSAWRSSARSRSAAVSDGTPPARPRRLPASRCSPLRTSASCPAATSTSTRETRSGRPASCCSRGSGITATVARESAPNVSGPSTSDTFSLLDAPRSITVTFCSEPLLPSPRPIAAAVVALRPMPPGASVVSGSVRARPSSVASPTVVPMIVTVVLRPPFATTVAVCSSSGAARLTPGSSSTRSSSCPGTPSGPRASSCSVAEPAAARTTSPAEPAMLPLATSVANTSATATATPRPASSSCAVCTRSRLRYR